MNRSLFRVALAVLMATIGVLHFAMPLPFVAIVPSYLPAPLLLVQISGGCEILGAIGILVPATRAAAGWGLILLYIAVFPANLNMALHPLPPSLTGGRAVPPIVLWLRLPLQLVLIAWAHWVSSNRPRRGRN